MYVVTVMVLHAPNNQAEMPKDKLNRNRPLRLDDMRCGDWSPLTPRELQRLAPIKLAAGESVVDRLVLARLLGERDRLQCVLQASDWLLKEMVKAGVIDFSAPVDTKNLDEFERAIYCLRNTVLAAKEKTETVS